MKNVKWIFVVLLMCSLISFVDKNTPTSGLNVGDKAPNFTIKPIDGNRIIKLKDIDSKYILLSFWAAYDAKSRMSNAELNYIVNNSTFPVKMVSVSFDEYLSILNETVKEDHINIKNCYVETMGEKSDLYRTYRLHKGFNNYLLNDKGVIIAKNISASDFRTYIK